MKLPDKNTFLTNDTALYKGNSLNFMWSVDKDFNFISTNPTLKKLIKNLTGTSDLKGNNLKQLELALPGLKGSEFKNNCERAFNGESFTEIVFMQFPDETWMEISYHPIVKDNTIICCACYFHDITERKISAQEIRYIHNRISGFISALPDVIKEEQNKQSEKINLGIQQQLIALKNDVAGLKNSVDSNSPR